MTGAHTTRTRSALTALTGLLLVLAVLAGVPAALWWVAGNPWPGQATSLSEILQRLRRPLGDPLAIDLLALIGWLCWAAFASAVLRESLWYLGHLGRLRADRNLHAAHLETLPTGRLLIAACLGSALLTLLATLRPQPAGAHPAPPAVATASVHALPAATTTNEHREGRTVPYRVRAGDTLWDIATHHLGDPIRWPEIYALSTHIPQPDGQRLTDPDYLRPGWTLHLPHPAPNRTHPPHREAPNHGTDEPPAHPGASLSPPHPDGTGHRREDERTTADTTAPHQTRQPATRPVHVPVGAASLIGVTTAAGIAAAVALARRNRRRGTPSSPTSEPPDLSHAVRAATHATLAALRAEQDEADAREAGIARRPAPAAPQPPGTVVCARRNGSELPLDALATPGGWNLRGPGAQSTARALAIAILSAAHRSTPPSTRLITTQTLAEQLLPGLHPHVPGWEVTPDAEQALCLAQTGRVERARIRETGHDDPPGPTQPALDVLLLDAHPSPHLDGLARNATPGDLAVISIDGDHLANTAHIAADGTVEHASGPHGHTLDQAAMFVLAPEPARDITHTLNAAHQPAPPTPAATIPRPLALPTSRTGKAAPPAAGDHATTEGESPPTPKAHQPAAQPPLTVRLFGGLSLHTSRGEIPLTMKEAAKEFLALLAAHPTGLRTDTLTEALRLSLDPERAAKDLINLRRALRRTLRQATHSPSAAFVVQTAGRHRLDPQLVHSDLVTFTTALDQAGRTEDAAERARQIHAALDVYQGHLCEGADYPWADELREHLRHKAVDAAVQLANHTAPHNPRQALALLEQAATWEPTGETICQRLITLHHQLGQPEAARHVYQRLTRHLAEIDEAPTQATRRLAESAQQAV